MRLGLRSRVLVVSSRLFCGLCCAAELAVAMEVAKEITVPEELKTSEVVCDNREKVLKREGASCDGIKNLPDTPFDHYLKTGAYTRRNQNDVALNQHVSPTTTSAESISPQSPSDAVVYTRKESCCYHENDLTKDIPDQRLHRRTKSASGRLLKTCFNNFSQPLSGNRGNVVGSFKNLSEYRPGGRGSMDDYDDTCCDCCLNGDACCMFTTLAAMVTGLIWLRQKMDLEE